MKSNFCFNFEFKAHGFRLLCVPCEGLQSPDRRWVIYSWVHARVVCLVCLSFRVPIHIHWLNSLFEHVKANVEQCCTTVFEQFVGGEPKIVLVSQKNAGITYRVCFSQVDFEVLKDFTQEQLSIVARGEIFPEPQDEEVS